MYDIFAQEKIKKQQKSGFMKYIYIYIIITNFKLYVYTTKGDFFNLKQLRNKKRSREL